MARMKKMLIITLLGLIVFFMNAFKVQAIVDPRVYPNNRFGIHISDTDDIPYARELVNSNGGDWGYVTVVIRENDRSIEAWQEFFNLLRDNNLIPIVRIATFGEGNVWAKPSPEDAREWAEFLNQLTWVIKNRYVVIFNEPNHAKEWGGDIRPDEYAEVLRSFYRELKAQSEDFFVLPAGLDDAATDTLETMNSARFFKEMYQQDAQVFSLMDGWTSHSYPNPNFSGSVTDTGPGTIRGFEAELRLARQFGFDHTKPVFITETGWAHDLKGLHTENGFMDTKTTANALKNAFATAWNQDQVVAVTPFILDYPEPPFAQFSFRLKSGEWLEHFSVIQSMQKTRGMPERVDQSSFKYNYLPDHILPEKKYRFLVEFENTGQVVWKPETHLIRVITNLPNAKVEIEPVPITHPGDMMSTFVALTVPDTRGEFTFDFQLVHEDQPFGQKATSQIAVADPTDLKTRLRLWWWGLIHSDQFIIALVRPGYQLRKDEEV